MIDERDRYRRRFLWGQHDEGKDTTGNLGRVQPGNVEAATVTAAGRLDGWPKRVRLLPAAVIDDGDAETRKREKKRGAVIEGLVY